MTGRRRRGDTHRTPSPTDYGFVSCDIVGHSGETDVEVQRARIAAINATVARFVGSSGDPGAVWASGGDGGHVALPAATFAPRAVQLIVALKGWSAKAGAPLRVAASRGVATPIEGADGRVQLVGHGINFAGRLLQRADPMNVVVSRAFRDGVESARIEGVRFHDQSDVELPYFGAQQVSVMSVSGEFESIGLPVAATNDRLALERALERPGAALEALYRAKRLLQVDPEDRQALDALLTLAERRDLVAAGSEVADLVLDRDFGGEFTRQAQLVERRQGDLICREDDRGTTMFLVLRGEVGGFASASGGEQRPIAAPDFRIAPGALVGELAFALKRPRTATLWCLQDSALLAFSHSELINASPDPQVRKELEEAVNRTIRARVVEYVGRTVPYLAGPGGPLPESDATWAKLRRGSRLISRQWREEPVLTPDDEAIAAPGVYVLIRGVLESGTVRLDGTKQPLVYADLPGDLTWRRGRYTLGDDVMLLAIASDVLRDFGAQTYREIVARVRAELEANAGVEGGPARRQPGPVFVSYSHRDASWLELLRTHLEPYARDGALDVWSDEGIPTGSRWLDEIEAALRATRVAVLLVTPHFLASRFIAERELPPILDAAEREGLRVVWIPISHSSYERTPIGRYQAAHDPSRPLDSLRPAERNKALVEICRRIGEATAAVA